MYYVENKSSMFTSVSGTEIPIVIVYGPFDSVSQACDKIFELSCNAPDSEEWVIKWYN